MYDDVHVDMPMGTMGPWIQIFCRNSILFLLSGDTIIRIIGYKQRVFRERISFKSGSRWWLSPETFLAASAALGGDFESQELLAKQTDLKMFPS